MYKRYRNIGEYIIIGQYDNNGKASRYYIETEKNYADNGIIRMGWKYGYCFWDKEKNQYIYYSGERFSSDFEQSFLEVVLTLLKDLNGDSIWRKIYDTRNK